MKRAVWFFTLAAAANYAALIWAGVLTLGGLKPLDLRITGYSYEDVLYYLSWLDLEAAQILTTTVRRLDTSFPILLGLALAGWLWQAVGQRRAWRFVVLVPFAYIAADLYENHLVGEILAGILPSAELVARASLMTMLKWALLVLSFVGLVGLTTGEED